MKIIPQRAITSLTNALDFVGTDEFHHGKRVALMAGAIAEEMNWPIAPTFCSPLISLARR